MQHMPWKACHLICFLVCVLFNAERKKGNTEVFYCPPLSSFLRRVEKQKQRTSSFCYRKYSTGWMHIGQAGKKPEGVEPVSALLCMQEWRLCCWLTTTQGLCGLAFHRHSSHFRAWLTCVVCSSTGSTLPPHIWVMGSAQNFNQKLVKLGKKSAFLAQIKVQDSFCC